MIKIIVNKILLNKNIYTEVMWTRAFWTRSWNKSIFSKRIWTRSCKQDPMLYVNNGNKYFGLNVLQDCLVHPPVHSSPWQISQIKHAIFQNPHTCSVVEVSVFSKMFVKLQINLERKISTFVEEITSLIFL